MVGEGYLLRRNDFQEVVVGWHAGLLEDTSLADVTLVCGSTFLPAHRVVLAASSKVFRDMLVSATLHPHPIVYLHGIAPSIMLDILKFIHLGKVEVDAATFNSFLAAAMELQVEGLHGTAEEVEGQENKEVEAQVDREAISKLQMDERKREEIDVQVVSRKGPDEEGEN